MTLVVGGAEKIWNFKTMKSKEKNWWNRSKKLWKKIRNWKIKTWNFHGVIGASGSNRLKIPPNDSAAMALNGLNFMETDTGMISATARKK